MFKDLVNRGLSFCLILFPKEDGLIELKFECVLTLLLDASKLILEGSVLAGRNALHNEFVTFKCIVFIR